MPSESPAAPRCLDQTQFWDLSPRGWLSARPKTPSGAGRRVLRIKYPHVMSNVLIRPKHRCTRRPRANHAYTGAADFSSWLPKPLRRERYLVSHVTVTHHHRPHQQPASSASTSPSPGTSPAPKNARAAFALTKQNQPRDARELRRTVKTLRLATYRCVAGAHSVLAA